MSLLQKQRRSVELYHIMYYSSRHFTIYGTDNVVSCIFARGSIDSESDMPDIVIFTETDGRVFFAQPYNAFISRINDDYRSYVKIDKNVEFKKVEAVVNGSTYLLKTNGDNKFYVKLKVIDMQ